MPQTVIRVFRDEDGTIPLKDWLEGLKQTGSRAYAKCLERIELLAQLGNELRRPLADILRDGVYELRMKVGKVNYRILYFSAAPMSPAYLMASRRKAKSQIPRSRPRYSEGNWLRRPSASTRLLSGGNEDGAHRELCGLHPG
jgi:hypothetical protein